MLTAESLKEFLEANLNVKAGKLEIREHRDYFIIQIINTRRKISLQKTSTTLLFMARLERMIPKRNRRLKDIILINKRWASIDAMCVLYARRKRQRLICVGRPEAVAVAVDLYKPDVLTTISWEPTVLEACRGKEILLYYTRKGAKVYICKIYNKLRYLDINVVQELKLRSFV